jgi:Na+/H+ antiporter NhaD/arsenite permease-like protein
MPLAGGSRRCHAENKSNRAGREFAQPLPWHPDALFCGLVTTTYAFHKAGLRSRLTTIVGIDYAF